MLNYQSFVASWSTIQFEHPTLMWYAIPAAAVTAVVWFIWWRSRVSAIKQYGDLELVTKFTALPSLSKGLVSLVALVSIVVLGFAAGTMPFQPLGAVTVPAGTMHMVAAFDASISMAAEDQRADRPRYGGTSCTMIEGPCGNRIDIAKLILMNQIMPAIDGNPIGMVIYSGAPVIRSYVTDDYRPLRQMMTTWHWVDVGGALGGGSFVDEGLLSAVKILKHDFDPKPGQPKASNVIVLFTDGGNDSSDEDLAKAVEEVKKIGALLVVVNIGSTKPSPIPLYDSKDKPMFGKDGKRSYFLGEEDKIAATARDDAFAKRLADQAGGIFVQVTPGQQLKINWPASLAGSKATVAKKELYYYPVAAAMTIIAMMWLAALTRLLSFGGDRRERTTGR